MILTKVSHILNCRFLNLAIVHCRILSVLYFIFDLYAHKLSKYHKKRIKIKSSHKPRRLNTSDCVHV